MLLSVNQIRLHRLQLGPQVISNDKRGSRQLAALSCHKPSFVKCSRISSYNVACRGLYCQSGFWLRPTCTSDNRASGVWISNRNVGASYSNSSHLRPVAPLDCRSSGNMRPLQERSGTTICYVYGRRRVAGEPIRGVYLHTLYIDTSSRFPSSLERPRDIRLSDALLSRSNRSGAYCRSRTEGCFSLDRDRTRCCTKRLVRGRPNSMHLGLNRNDSQTTADRNQHQSRLTPFSSGGRVKLSKTVVCDGTPVTSHNATCHYSDAFASAEAPYLHVRVAVVRRSRGLLNGKHKQLEKLLAGHYFRTNCAEEWAPFDGW